MNETFSFSRFGKYFLFDLKQNWRRHSRPALLIGCSGLIIYVVWVLFSLIFTQQWHGPLLPARLVVFMLAFGILELYYCYLYGFVTDKRKGSSYLMIPASTTEKFVSLLLMALIVIPLLFSVVYLALDGVLCLADKTCGASLVGSMSDGYRQLLNVFGEMWDEGFPFTLSQLVYPTVCGLFCNFLFFVLCGLCFKKYKIVGAIAVTFLISILTTFLMGLFINPISNYFAELDPSAEQVTGLMRTILHWTNAITTVATLALGAGIFFRLKTIKH